MKKTLFCAPLLCLLSVCSTNVFANYLNFAGIQGSSTLSSQFTLTTCSGPINCTPNPVLTPTTVTFSSVSCQPGQCTGRATSVFEAFSTPVVAFALFSAPSNQTTVTFLLQGHQVGPTLFQSGGMYNLQKSAHTEFDTVEFSWSTPTNFRFYQGSFDPVPEPSTLVLLSSGLVGVIGVVRRKLF